MNAAFNNSNSNPKKNISSEKHSITNVPNEKLTSNKYVDRT